MNLREALANATPGPLVSVHPGWHVDPNSRALEISNGKQHVATWIRAEDASLLALGYNLLQAGIVDALRDASAYIPVTPRTSVQRFKVSQILEQAEAEL